MESKSSFYGTPLNRSLNSDQNDETPNSTRKARLNHQQTVRDDHGRQRFHGAFTGGFSAGYHNTVDSTAGFQPRQFVSHRGKSRDGGGSSFTHNPEDYMDEEDLGEFGIAPRKVRISSKYTSNDSDPISRSSSRFALGGHLKPANLSVGEFILENLSSNRSDLVIDTFTSRKPAVKNDFHGLGYKPLDATLSHTNFLNPLTAVLKSGKRLKISGEAFGTGVMDDDEDYLTTNEAYGYDDLGNYEFNRGSKPQSDRKSKPSSDTKSNIELVQDFYRIVGFIPAKHVEMMLICDIQNNYPTPTVPNDWKMPVRSEIYVPPTNTAANSQQLDLESRQSSSAFNKKFTPGFKTIETDNIESKRGLVLYSDLKAKSKACDNSDRAVVESQDTKASIVREEIEWRPCSLLCKHFNVPNPYPDNLYVGVKPKNRVEQQVPPTSTHEQPQVDKVTHQKPASMEIKQMIFDVTFTNYFADDKKEAPIAVDKDDSEDDPQVVEVEDSMVRVNSEQTAQATDSDEEDPDVLVVTAPKREPELIVLSSSSSQSSPTSQELQSRSLAQPVHGMHGSAGCHLLNEPSDSTDTYGPPLPPTLRTLIDLDRRAGRYRTGSVQSHRKKKKHKKSKRNS